MFRKVIFLELGDRSSLSTRRDWPSKHKTFFFLLEGIHPKLTLKEFLERKIKRG